MNETNNNHNMGNGKGSVHIEDWVENLDVNWDEEGFIDDMEEVLDKGLTGVTGDEYQRVDLHHTYPLGFNVSADADDGTELEVDLEEMDPDIAEFLSAIAVGALSAIFISALIILILLLRRHRAQQAMNEGHFIRQSEIGLISKERLSEPNEDRSVRNLDKIVEDKQWVGDVASLVPHCLTILKLCRFLTEQLTAVAMESTNSKKCLNLVVQEARKISGRVDELVSSMYPPLDLQLLEARAAALTLSVSQLILIAKYECGHQASKFCWIDDCLREINKSMSVLRSAALSTSANKQC